jgi:hypothetical protein
VREEFAGRAGATSAERAASGLPPASASTRSGSLRDRRAVRAPLLDPFEVASSAAASGGHSSRRPPPPGSGSCSCWRCSRRSPSPGRRGGRGGADRPRRSAAPARGSARSPSSTPRSPAATCRTGSCAPSTPRSRTPYGATWPSSRRRGGRTSRPASCSAGSDQAGASAGRTTYRARSRARHGGPGEVRAAPTDGAGGGCGLARGPRVGRDGAGRRDGRRARYRSSPGGGVNLHFLHPWLLLFLVPIAAYLVWVVRVSAPAVPLPRMASVSPPSDRFRRILGRLPQILRALVLALLVVAIARPRSAGATIEAPVEGVPIVIAFDISSSMLAEDFAPRNRLEVAPRTDARLHRARDGGPDRAGRLRRRGDHTGAADHRPARALRRARRPAESGCWRTAPRSGWGSPPRQPAGARAGENRR